MRSAFSFMSSLASRAAHLTLVPSAALLLGLSGCASLDEDDERLFSTTEALSASLGGDGLDSLSAPDPAQAAADFSQAKAGDESCRTRTLDPSDPHVVHVTLNGCTKRFGRRVVDGKLTLTFSEGEAGALHIERVSEDLRIDGRPASLRASTDLTFSGDSRTAQTQSTLTRTREDGSELVRSGSHTLTFDRGSLCRVLEGSSTSTLDGEPLGNGRSELSWCELEDGTELCPVGEVEHHRPARGKHVLTRFDGSATAQAEVTTPRRSFTRTIPLSCQAQ